jgi:hypothetical protein
MKIFSQIIFNGLHLKSFSFRRVYYWKLPHLQQQLIKLFPMIVLLHIPYSAHLQKNIPSPDMISLRLDLISFHIYIRILFPLLVSVSMCFMFSFITPKLLQNSKWNSRPKWHTLLDSKKEKGYRYCSTQEAAPLLANFVNTSKRWLLHVLHLTSEKCLSASVAVSHSISSAEDKGSVSQEKGLPKNSTKHLENPFFKS